MDACQLVSSLVMLQNESSNANQSFSPLFTMVHLVLSELILSRFSNLQKFLARFWFSLQSQLGLGNSELWEDDDGNQDSEISKQTQESCSDNKRSDERSISREDVEMVMENLGLFCSSESEELKEWMGSDEISQLFDEKEPSLEEVKEAFNVFDHNSDGFVDARELQRVFYKLGLKEGLQLEKCRKIIRTFDENGDGRIDFNEFVKFMENSFC
ncbi:calcium-binding protein CML46 [Populus alba x Populus x berolinensis]|uniref:Calcium-binding protein CML46 n=1 Tax=Populus alba x Populus x berolinensis TaxID=444605 RepID=A0AAD6PT07_9ROSI|nr:calcium-binding protein CML46 [Populus alba x Populus x berolinensis]